MYLMRENKGIARICAVAMATIISCVLSFFSITPQQAHADSLTSTSTSTTTTTTTTTTVTTGGSSTTNTSTASNQGTAAQENPWIQYQAINHDSSIYTMIYQKGYAGTVKALDNPCASVQGSGSAKLQAQCNAYSFRGWAYYTVGKVVTVTPGQVLSDPPYGRMMYGIWFAKNPYTLTYKADGSTHAVECTYSAKGCTVTVSNDASRKGYVLSSWNTKSDGSGVSYKPGEEVTLTQNITLYAQWTANTATLNLHLNNGSGSVSSMTADVGISVTLLSGNDVTRTGYTLTGWNTVADGSGKQYSPGASYALPAGGEDLYAQWIPNASVIIYNANGGTGYIPDTVGNTGEPSPLEENTFTRPGYHFVGWGFTQKAAMQDIMQPGEDSIALPPNGITMYAQWAPNKSSVKYDANGGSGQMPDTVGVTDSTVTLAKNTFTRQNYIFTGWSTERKANNLQIVHPGASVVLSADDVTMYAQWAPIPATVTYIPNGGTGAVASSVGTPGETIMTGVSAFIRSGYVFKEWNTAADGSGKSYGAGQPFTLPVGDTTLYAQWIKIINRTPLLPSGPRIVPKTTTLPTPKSPVVIPRELVAPAIPAEEPKAQKTEKTNEPNDPTLTSEPRSKGKQDSREDMRVQGDGVAPAEAGYEKNAGLLVGVASALFVSVAAACFPMASGAALVGTGTGKASLFAKITGFLHR